MMPLGNYLMPYFKITPERFSYIVAAYSISAGFSAFSAMFFVDKFDRKKVVVFAYTGFLIGTFCCGISPNYYFLMISRIVAGIFGGILGAQVLSIVADSFAYEVRGRAMGILFGAFALASVVGVPLSLSLSDVFGWHIPFYLIVSIGIIVLVAIIKFLPNYTSHLNNLENENISAKEKIKQIVFKKLNITAFALSGFLMMGHFVIIPFLNPFMQFNIGFDKHQRNLVYIVGGLVSIVGARIAGKLADKYGKPIVFYYCAAISIIPILLITNLVKIEYYFVLMITGFWFLMSTGRNIPAQAIVSNIVPPHQRGGFQSFNSCITSIFVGLASLISGKVVLQEVGTNKILHYPVVGLISVAIVLFSIFLGLSIQRQIRNNIQ